MTVDLLNSKAGVTSFSETASYFSCTN